MKKKTHRRVLSAVLGAALAISLLPGVPAAAAGTSDEDPVSVKAVKSYAQDAHYKVPDEFIDALGNKKSLSRSSFERIALENKISAEFMQLFYRDSFIYKSGDAYEHVPLDSRLKRNTHDWDNLVYLEDNLVDYIRDGKRRAIKGIDVSKHQGDIDWERVRADGVRYAFIRLGYRGYGTGKMMIDGYYEKNMKEAAAAGVDVGVYFYSQAINKQEAEDEARVVLENLEGYDIAYPVVFDIEGAPNASARTAGLTKKQMTDIAIAFCDKIEAAGYRPMLYSYTKLLTTGLDLSRLEGIDKWVANYYKVPYYPYSMQILQYTSKGRVDGIDGNVDMNLCFKNY